MVPVNSISRPKPILEQIEFACLMTALLFSTFTAFRHPAVLFTASDMFLTVAVILRCNRSLPLFPLQSASSVWFIGMLMMVAGLSIGSIAHGDPVSAFVVIVQYFFSFVLLPLAILGRPYEEAVTLAKVGVISIALNCLVGMIAYGVGYSGGESRYFMLVSGNYRVAGLVDNPNGLAGLIVLWFPVLWYLGLTGALRKLPFLALFGLLAITLIYASSNSSLAGAVICGALFLLLVGNQRVLMIWGTAVTTMAWISIQWAEFIFPPTFRNRVLSPLLEGDLSHAGTFEDRADLMIEAWRFLPDYFLVGMGAGQYRELSSQGIPVHNLYLLLANEGGILALLGLCFVLGSAIVYAVMARHNVPNRVYGRATVVTVTLTFAALSMNYTHVYQRGMLIPWIVALGLLAASDRYRRR